MTDPHTLHIADFNYPLPDELIAKHPLSERDRCRLLVRYGNGDIEEREFSELPGLLPADSILVYNNTRVINARTGLILALGRVSGETAPILFTCAAYFLPQLPTGIFDQCMALPYHLYVISTSGTDMEAQLPLAYGTALVLIMIILFVNLLANALRKYFEKRVKTN